MRNIWGFYHYKFLRCSNKYFFHILQTSKLHQKFQKFMNKAIKKEKNWKTPKLYNVSSSNKKHSRNSSVIRQKGESHESQNGCFMKTKHAKFSEKRTFLTPWYAHVRPFALLPTISSFLSNRQLCVVLDNTKLDSGIWFVATPSVSFWTWIWPTRHCVDRARNWLDNFNIGKGKTQFVLSNWSNNSGAIDVRMGGSVVR